MSYWSRQLDRIKMSGGQPKIKLSNEEAATNWLNLTSEQYLQLEQFLLGMDGGAEPIESVHWFPDDLVVRTVGMVPQYGLVVQSERVHGTARLWVLRPGIAKPELWSGEECLLLRRVNKNKEGQ